ncbi:MAG TPA: SUF system Fe-S cluster assembly regulator [Candidatus Acidoferrales bacterium]|nr:SUF system Fe-S cluster assembly regulator [Candidatus Solibacter sp.]HTS61972.1 SUF system Fe-S cluster assembly regulator [Candidatus Acidoferrales bacterium]
MLKLSKKADYGLIALKHLAMHDGEGISSASDIAEIYGISAPLMAKVLQRLARKGLLRARHGSTGGYELARNASQITALEAISAIDGPVVITSCETNHGMCDHSERCTVREPLKRVNDGILQVLSTVTITSLADGTGLVELRG